MAAGDDFKSSPFSNISLLDKLLVAARYFFPQEKYITRYLQYGYLAAKHISNFADAARVLSGGSADATLNFRDGTYYRFKGERAKRQLFLMLWIKEKGCKITPSGDFSSVAFEHNGREIQLAGPDSLGLAYDVFFGREYSCADVRGRGVLDIGANIGDTAVYFALNGAKQVVALEPIPYSFRLAVQNVKRNHLEGRIEIVNAAIGASASSITLEDSGVSFGGSQIKEAKSGARVKVTTLGELTRAYGLGDAVLKSDCEGAEYDFILNSENSVLASFSAIVLEYHYGYLNLKSKLESAGFAVRLLKRPTYSFNEGWSHPHARVGMLLAVRRQRSN